MLNKVLLNLAHQCTGDVCDNIIKFRKVEKLDTQINS